MFETLIHQEIAMTTFTAQAPGRICLLGDNTDLIGKPCLAAAISAYLTIQVQKRDDERILLVAKDIDFSEELRLGEILEFDGQLKYLKAVINRLSDSIDCGFEATITSQIPVSAGMSSSTALCIAFIRVLGQAFGRSFDTAEIAELSYQIERYDLDIECGRMDQYAIAFEGVTYIETGEVPGVEKLSVSSLPIVVADTQEKHDTQQLQKWLNKRLAENDRVLWNALFRVADIVESGKQALIDGNFDHLGELMNRQQGEEKLMGTSTQRLEDFCEMARSAGALGAKQMGAGGGGCMIALCPPSGEQKVQAALQATGAPAWAFKIIG
jgi:mevalonate kinase